MVICLCKGVSDRKIRQLIAGGAKNLRDIMASCQAGSDCGACVCAVKDMLQAQQRSSAATPQASDEVVAPCIELGRAGNE